MKEIIIFVCTDSTEIFFSELRSAGLNYNLPSFSLILTVRGYLISIACSLLIHPVLPVLRVSFICIVVGQGNPTRGPE